MNLFLILNCYKNDIFIITKIMKLSITDRNFDYSQYPYNNNKIITINNKKLFPLPKKQFKSALELIYNTLHTT